MNKALLGICLAMIGAIGPACSQTDFPKKRWVYLASNLLVDGQAEKEIEFLQRAKNAGYNGVLFTDYKIGFWWHDEGIKTRYTRNAEKFSQGVKDLGLEFAVVVMPFGYASSWLGMNPNLAQGVPIRDCPMIVKGGHLVPEPTVEIPNGSFEIHKGDKVSESGFQDDPGVVTFIDSAVKHDGEVSLRMSPKAGGPENNRIFYTLKVKPWQHYRIRCWLKAESLNAEALRIPVMAKGRTLQYQFLSRPDKGTALVRFEKARDLSFDWTEQIIDFNSLEHEEVSLIVGLWGAKSGNLWVDQLSIESAPTLNLLRRDDLPFSLKSADGTSYEEGKDIEAVADENLGHAPYRGEFSTRQDLTAIRLTKESRLKEGDRVKLSGFHPHLVYDGQVNCAMLHPDIWKLAKEQTEEVCRLFKPDVIFMSHDEIRSVGWDPAEAQLENAGKVLAENIKQAQAIASSAGGGRPIMVWSDMFDPTHNARKDFYLARGSTEGSWEGLDNSTWIMKWGDGDAAKSLDFFQKRGHRLMVAAFYDSDVAKDAESWKKTLQSVGPIEGIMYTTWSHDYSQLETFARLWWPDKN